MPYADLWAVELAYRTAARNESRRGAFSGLTRYTWLGWNGYPVQVLRNGVWVYP